MPGYEIDRFVDLTQNEKNELICSICQDILRCPVVTNCCLQSFCDDCINDWLKNNTTCPYDRKTLTTDQLSRATRMVMNLLGRLRIRCDFRDNGCDKVICLENLSNHLEQCQYNNQYRECEKCFCCNIKANHDCVEYLLDRVKCLVDTNNKITTELNQFKLSNVELKKEKENILNTIDEIKNELKCSSENYVKVLETVLTLIEKITNNRSSSVNEAVLTPISEALYLIVKNDRFKSNTNEVIARKVITNALDILHLKYDETQVTLFTLHTLLMFKIPEDLEFEYNRLANIVTHIIDNKKVDNSVLEISLYMLFCLTLVKSKKHAIGNEKCIKTLIGHIKEKADDVIVINIVIHLWNILWNLTDDNAAVCDLFCTSNGLQCFSECYALLNTNIPVVQAIFGVMENLATCPQLRHHLLDKVFIKMFLHHLDWKGSYDELEQCFIVCGILSHLLLVNEEMWNRKLPNILYTDVQRALNAAIPRWDVKIRRLTFYDSFKPFQQILASEQSPNESKLWIIWMLANFTNTNATKYCPYLEDYNLLELVDSIAKSTDCPTNVRSLALTVMQNYKSHKCNEK